jgi:hypothetical protein
MKFCYSKVNGWNWRTSSYVKLSRFRRPKITCSPPFAYYRPKTNAVILLDMGLTHTKVRMCTGRIGKGKET